MDPDRFLEIFKLQFEEPVRTTITLNSAFKQIQGWSSLQALIVTVAMNEEWGISFTDEDFRNSQIVNDLLHLTQIKTQG